MSCGLMSKARRNARVKSDALLKPKVHVDGKAIERWGVLQEIGHPKKTAHANSMF